MTNTHSLPHKLPQKRRFDGQPPRYFLFSVYVFFVLLSLCQAITARANIEPAIDGPEHGSPLYSAKLPINSASSYGHAGQLLWREGVGQYQPALVLDTHYEVNITGPVAKVVLKQRFQNPSNEWREGTYVYPLSETSSVHHLSITAGDKKIIAQIQEKSLAKKLYNQAKNSGKKAALLEQLRDNIFKQALANIAPGETIDVEIHLLMAVDYNHPTFSLSLPTTITSRFTPFTLSKEQAESAIINEATEERVSATSQNKMSINITLDGQTAGADQVRSSSHSLSSSYDGQQYQITTQKSRVLMDRDFHLAWSLPAGSDPHSAFYSEQVGKDHYGLLMVTPPEAPTMDVAQDIIFVIDTSGSMGGGSMDQAKTALSQALAQLTAQDYFNIIEFNDDFRAVFPQSVPATSTNLTTAQGFTEQLEADGGTQMLPALMEALATPHSNASRLRQIVFITDGAVGNEIDLLHLIHNQLGDARLFTVGIGSAPNGFFMRKAAEMGRGSFVFIDQPEQVSTRMKQLFNQLSHAVLSDVNIEWPQPVEAWPKRIPDLYLQQPLVVAVKFDAGSAPQNSAFLQGSFGDGSLWQSALDLSTTELPSHTSATGIAKLWAKKKINALLDQAYLGVDNDQVKSAVLPIALQHQLLTPFTSFVAVEESPSRTGGDALVAEKLALTSPAKIQLPAPQTATASLPLTMAGLLLLTIAMVLKRFTLGLGDASHG